MGVADSLSKGVISPAKAVELFFHADNCRFVRKQLREKAADQVMGHGVQLADLFDALPPKEAKRELTGIRDLCLELLGWMRLAA